MKSLFPPVLCLFLALALPVHADVTREEAAAAVQREGGGRVLSVDRADLDGRSAWRVKVLTPQGVVKGIYLESAARLPRDAQGSAGDAPGVDTSSETSQSRSPFAPARPRKLDAHRPKGSP